MGNVRLGSTGIIVNKTGFGGLPIQRIDDEAAERLLWMAIDAGINFFDTGKTYSDSEVKLGRVLSKVREKVYIATKTPAKNAEEFWADLEESLNRLQTDYIDIYQFHNPSFCPKPNDGSGLYEAMLEAKGQGKIKYIGMTNHRLNVAKEAVESGLYDTLQFPFSYLASSLEEELVKLCEEKNVGFICMKAMSGGLITRSDVAYAYLSTFKNALPIWGMQKESELDEFLSYQDNPPILTEEMNKLIEEERKALSGEFCRGCGYCMPCPMGIEINNAARMSLMLRRSPSAGWLSSAWQEKMAKIDSCINCGACMKKCPYHLETPKLLKKNYEDYKNYL